MLQQFKEWAKNNIPKLILYIVLAITILAGIKYIADLFKTNERLHEELIGQKTAYVQLSEHAAKLEIQYKSQEDLKAELEKNWKAEKDALQGRVKILSNATYLIREQARKENRSDLVYEGAQVKYVFNEIRFKDGPPVGYVLIFDDGRVVSRLYTHQINVYTAVSRDESKGYYNIVSKADYTLKSPHLSLNEKNWMNVPYPLKIVGGTAFIDPTEPVQLSKRFHLWSLTLNGGFNVGSDLKAQVGVSLMGYGYSVRDLDWKFLQFGIDYSKENEYGIHLIPAMYRPFPSYLKNTYIGAGVGLDDRGYNPFLSLSVGF
jgi:hypothetical protein